MDPNIDNNPFNTQESYFNSRPVEEEEMLVEEGDSSEIFYFSSDSEFQATQYFSSHYENLVRISLEKVTCNVNLSSYTKNAGKEENVASLNTILTNIVKLCPPNK